MLLLNLCQHTTPILFENTETCIYKNHIFCSFTTHSQAWSSDSVPLGCPLTPRALQPQIHDPQASCWYHFSTSYHAGGHNTRCHNGTSCSPSCTRHFSTSLNTVWVGCASRPRMNLLIIVVTNTQVLKTMLPQG
jgi:hypothetical protein